MSRVTIKDLENAVEYLNKLIDDFQIDKNFSYGLSGAYGGWQLVKYVNEFGGAEEITSGHRPKSETLDLIVQYRKGYEQALSDIQVLKDAMINSFLAEKEKEHGTKIPYIDNE